jgi:hypothetical protein
MESDLIGGEDVVTDDERLIEDLEVRIERDLERSCFDSVLLGLFEVELPELVRPRVVMVLFNKRDQDGPSNKA